MSCRASILALAALWLASPQSAIAATSMTNPVTGESETYVNTFTGSTAEWDTTDHWDTGVRPFISGANVYTPSLVDGKEALTTTAIDGYLLRVGAYNGASITWSGGISKIQAGGVGCWLTADETSSITIASFGGNQLEGSDSAPFKLTSANAGGITWSAGLTSANNTSLPFWYYLKGEGTVVYGGDITVGNAQVIKQADITLSGTSQVTSKTLVSFGSGTTKAFTANAIIKRFNSVGTDLNNNTAVFTVNSTGSTTLTTSHAVGSCELVQTSTGIVLYWVDGDPAELPPAAVYKPSININFTNGAANGLTTSDDVGLAGYAVPGVSWNNYAVANSTFSPVNSIDSNGVASVESGVNVTISGSRGSYSCSALTPASNPLHGYIDENDSNPTPTVTVTGIPYYKYRAVVYHSTDTANVKFAYDTINDTNYTYVDSVLTEGTTAWGDTGEDYGANAIAEGVNTLVTGELSGSTLTVVGHRVSSSVRGTIAAIQIIEVKPEITVNDLEIPVSGDTVYTVSEAKNLSGTVYITGNGTLTLGGTAKISAATINVGHSVVLNVNTDRLDGTTFTGEGTVVYNNSLPAEGKGWIASTWSGTVWINGKSGVADFNVNSYGNANSTVKLSGVDGQVSSIDNTVPVVLENGDFDYALKLTGGSTTFVKVSGNGTLADGGSESPMLKIYDGTEFSGAITNTRARIVFTSATSTTLPDDIPEASIYIDKGNSVTVPSGKTWTADGGFIVEGTLIADGTLASSADSAVSGSGTVTFGGVPSPTGDAWWKNAAWIGTVEIKGATALNGDYVFNNYGNADSTLKLTNCSGWLKPNYTCVPALEIGGTFTWNDGSSGLNNTFKVGTLKGSGTISIPNQGAQTAVWQITDDWSNFTGPVVGNNTAARRILVFGPTLPTTIAAGDIYVSEGSTLDLDNSSGAWWGVGMRFVVDGTVKASARTKWGGGTAMALGDSGVLELVTGSSYVNDTAVDYSKVTGTGTVRYTGSNWRSLPDGDYMFATTLSIELENNTGVVFNGGSADGSAGTIGGIFGTKNLRTDLGGYNKVLTVKQAKDGVWSGSFLGGNDRLDTFIVDPGAYTTGTLTLDGTHTHNNKMTVNGSVNLTGIWVGDTTVNGTFGGIGTLKGNLAFNAGSIFRVLEIDEDGLKIDGITYPDDNNKVKVDLSALDFQDVNSIPLFLSNNDIDVNKFELIDKTLKFDFVSRDRALILERNNDIKNAYSDSVTLTLNNIGSTPITDYTLLVRISKEQFPGFSYDRAGYDGSEIAFMDGEGRILSHEIDTWNTHGESVVWVKVPKAVDGTKVIFYWSLKDDAEAPVNVSSNVWSDYAGVWHMNDAKDSTENHATGEKGPSASVSDSGLFGRAIGATVTGDNDALITVKTNAAINALAGSGFTVSGWVSLNTLDADWAYLFSKKLDDGTDAWGLQFRGDGSHGQAYNSRIWVNGTEGSCIIKDTPFVKGQWHYITLVFAKDGGSKVSWYMDGSALVSNQAVSWDYGTDGFSIGGLPEGHGTLNGKMDEVRLRKGVISTTQIQAEIANTKQSNFLNAVEGDGVSFLVPSTVVRDGVAHDYWVKSPSISPDYWTSDAPPATISYTPGILRSGSSVTNWCENLLTHEEYDVSSDTLRSLPVGTYCIHCKTEGAFEIDKDEEQVSFTIVKDSGLPTVGDTAGGRILLMNNDFSQGGDEGSPSIGGQGYSDTNETASVYCYWAFPDGFDDIGLTINPKPGKSSILWSVDGDTTNKLWHLVSSRHGNTFPSDGSDLVPGQNYLPWSTKSCSITNGNVAAQSGADAGQILMLNTTDAMVYSPCYDEGIGTIYFDAVNGYTNNLAAYQLLVEYATVTTNHTPVVDANLWQYDDDDNVTNYYGNLDETCWQACQVKVARVTGGDTIDYSSTFTGPFTLAVVSDSPTTGEFYRVYAELNIREPVRFRIRRANFDSDRELDEAYLLLDNIIVSYPAMSATLSPAGQYDDTKKGSNVLGFESAFSSPFPHAGEKLYAKAKVDYYINSATNLTETNFLASAKMYYRWRYLNQPSPDGWEWKRVELFKNGDFFRSSEELDLPEIPGDVEFWYEYTLQAPYYSYVDYTGLPELQNAFAKEYTEATLGPQTNRSTKVDFSYPTMGTNWFVRLREGASSNEVWRIYLRNVDGSAYTAEDGTIEYIDLSITDSGSWRGFLRTPRAVEGGLEYRVEQINPRADDLSLTYATNFWKGVSTLTDTVKSVNLTSASGADEWSQVPCAATTGFLMFILDESSPSISVTSADLQNFDKWNDANKNDILFVGTSAEDDKKAGVSHTMRTYDAEFDKWAPSLATNKYWTEAFKATIGDERFPRYTTLDAGTETPNGWTTGKGMWVYEKFKDPQANSMALQMAGRGEGYLEFTGAAVNPRGIESISLKSRIAQSTSLDDFTVRDSGIDESFTNYCFIVQAAMSTNAVTPTGTWDSRFDGLGQISVLGGYRKNLGAYEFRITRWKEDRYRAELCKWVGNTCTVVNECAGDLNYAQMPYTMTSDGGYPTIFISVNYQPDGSCKVQAGCSCADNKYSNGNGHSKPGELPTNGKYLTLSYWDATPPTEFGSYGFASANCDAVFTGVRCSGKALDPEEFDTSTAPINMGDTYPYPGRFQWKDITLDLGGTSSENIAKRWSPSKRLRYDELEDKTFAVAEAQKLLVQWKRHGESELEWKTISTTNISSYTLSDTITIPVLFKEEADIRIKHGGSSSDDNCVDLVVDDVSVRQWRGDDYDNKETQTYFKDVDYGSPTNFVFTSAWLNEEGSVELTAARAATNIVSSLRSPLFDGDSDTGRGIGLGMFSFSYTNADSRAKLKLQIATNVTALTIAEYTKLLSDDSRWTDVATFAFDELGEEERTGGVMSHYLGLHGVKGAMRLVVDSATVAAAEASRDPTYGRIFITDATCRDEPNLDTSCWWGWNIRTSQDLYSADDKLLASLADSPGSGGADAGMSFALNNSTVDDILGTDYLTYKQHQPFLQTPIFTNNTSVGEISFKARRYDYPSEFTPRVCVYGANPISQHTDTSKDVNWTYVTHFDITNDVYQTYSRKFRESPYEVLRLVVVGMTDVLQKHGNPGKDAGYSGLKNVVRVALDDVVVTETLSPKLAFRNVFAFRGDSKTDLLGTKYVNRFGDKTAQPLAGEGWGVQADVVVEQLPDEIDFERGIDVTLYWYDGKMDPWGYANWRERSGVHSAKLVECDDKELAFRSSFNDGNSGSSIVGQSPEYHSNTVVQYMLSVKYFLKGSDTPISLDMADSDWVKPEWYNGVDYNAESEAFSAYTILDSVAPGWAWINEINVFGGYESYKNVDADRQYVEIAMPVEADITGWKLEFLTKTVTNTVCIFGADGVPGRKTTNSAQNCAFVVISSPTSKSNLETMTVGGEHVVVDGTWTFENNDGWNFINNSVGAQLGPIAARLLRPSGVIEHTITFEGTNEFQSVETSAATLAAELNAAEPGANWVAVGDDSIAGNYSLGVTNSPANLAANWCNTMARTPGFMNEGQVIDPDHPIANGVNYIIYATLAEDSAGHMTQSLGTDINTTSLAMAVVPKGTATNITYDVENWYQLESVKVNGEELSLDKRTGSIPLILGGPATSNNLTVVASSRVDPVLATKYELTPDNRYTSAVVDWLNKGKTLKGDFKSSAAEIKAAKLCDLSNNIVTNLTVTEMYWLDIDPTEDNWLLKAGIIRPPIPEKVEVSYQAGDPLVKLTMGMYMCLTNTASGDSFAPYVLRGFEPGSVSTDYTSSATSRWDGPTFRILGRLYNADMGGEDYFDDVALRWFVFDGNSFRPKGASDEFQSVIEVWDPYSSASPAYTELWDKYKGKTKVFFSWSIDGDNTLFAPQSLCPTNRVSY